MRAASPRHVRIRDLAPDRPRSVSISGPDRHQAAVLLGTAGRGIVFVSELKAFLEFPGFRPSLDRRAIGEFLEFGYTFEDDRTVLNGVNKLPPGHFMRVRANERPELERYYRPTIASDRTIKLTRSKRNYMPHSTR